ncbi:MAG: hypothetical protein ACLUHE_05455 [Christensenellales bacterium]
MRSKSGFERMAAPEEKDIGTAQIRQTYQPGGAASPLDEAKTRATSGTLISDSDNSLITIPF